MKLVYIAVIINISTSLFVWCGFELFKTYGYPSSLSEIDGPAAIRFAALASIGMNLNVIIHLMRAQKRE